MLTNGQFFDIRIRSLDGLYLAREFLNLLPLDLKDYLNLLYQLELSILNLGICILYANYDESIAGGFVL